MDQFFTIVTIEYVIVKIENGEKYDGPYKKEAHHILHQQLKKLKHHDDVDTVVEGFAFQYCPKGGDCAMYKFTGNFAPINQLLGLFKYGRGKMPAMRLHEHNERIENVIAIYPGRFQPMGKHHAQVFRKIQDERGFENTFIATSNKVEAPDSPFDFSEKQMIAAQHDIPASKVAMTKNPYKPLQKRDFGARSAPDFLGFSVPFLDRILVKSRNPDPS